LSIIGFQVFIKHLLNHHTRPIVYKIVPGGYSCVSYQCCTYNTQIFISHRLQIFGYLCVLSLAQRLRRLAKEDKSIKSKQSKIYYGDYTYDEGSANRYVRNDDPKRHNNYLYKPIKYRKIENKNLSDEYAKSFQPSNGMNYADSMEYPMLDNFRMSALPSKRHAAVQVPYEYRMPDPDYGVRGLPRTPLWIHNSGIPVLPGHPMAYNSRQYARRN